ncbi:hypothetical protein [Heyndrickxia sporothermodurans]|nr:hypothetical protein [Heyndrickxia sporothermodurans]MBL5783370.1 hypothetical protein [Heyndrickxia sporothermodurans]MBL5786892.1 hypothetical protein [Heyndrickxia sporothermodurans]MBL5790509.1 hypothetical protein [Heyndrickxia sporothermodurans]MBL5797649.1 hypothetical protein [Heyndrickxia sporothermodurans]MBL5804994.1 hypothetical protein [Heyndrickxia sporothermodurans]
MGQLTQEEINVDLFNEVKRLKSELRISQQKIDQLEETIRIYKISDEIVKEQSKKIKHLFPLENIVGYGQLCDKVLELTDENSFFVKAYTEKIMDER